MDKTHLSIVIPCLNEEKRIKKTADEVVSFMSKNRIVTELILIDDDYEIGDLCGVVRMSSPRLTKAIAAARAAIAKATGAP